MRFKTLRLHTVAALLAFFAAAFVAPVPGFAQDVIASRQWEVKQTAGHYDNRPQEVVFFIPGPGELHIVEDVQPFCDCGHTWSYFVAQYRKRGASDASDWERGWPREVTIAKRTCNDMVAGKPYRCESTLKVSPGGENYQVRIVMTPNRYRDGLGHTTPAQVLAVAVNYMAQGAINTGPGTVLPPTNPKGAGAGKSGDGGTGKSGDTVAGPGTSTGKSNGTGSGKSSDTGNKSVDAGTGKPSKEPADTTQLTIQAGSRIAKVGDTVTIPIWLIHGQGVANLNMNLGYDAAVVKATGAFAKGNLVPQALFEANTGESGIVRIGFAQNKDIVGPETGTLAQIAFTALGRPGDVTPLRVDVTTLSSAAGVKPSVATIHGEIRIVGSSGVIDGDSDRDGRLTARDAQNALKMSVRLMPIDMVCDMDRDGQVTSTDARLILQKVVGK
jgi:hypothetical protein